MNVIFHDSGHWGLRLDILIWAQVGNLAKVLSVNDMDWYRGHRHGEGDVGIQRLQRKELISEGICKGT